MIYKKREHFAPSFLFIQVSLRNNHAYCPVAIADQECTLLHLCEINITGSVMYQLTCCTVNVDHLATEVANHTILVFGITIVNVFQTVISFPMIVITIMLPVSVIIRSAGRVLSSAQLMNL